MSNPLYPTLADGMRPDSAQYEVTTEDVSMSTKMEAGYVYTRPRFLRAPRKTFKIGYQQLTDAHKAALDTFYSTTVKGGSVIFDWYNWEDLVTYAVRFKGELTFKYVGRGDYRVWDCSFTLEQA
jgi:hypothetical protein